MKNNRFVILLGIIGILIVLLFYLNLTKPNNIINNSSIINNTTIINFSNNHLNSSNLTNFTKNNLSETEKNKIAKDIMKKQKPFFVKNKGQKNEVVEFYLQAPRSTTFFTNNSTVYAYTDGNTTYYVIEEFVNSTTSKIYGENELPGKINYYVGNISLTNISTYEKIYYENIWPGIDCEIDNNLKFTYILKPNADYKNIKLKYSFANLTLNNGMLIIKFQNNVSIVLNKPNIYQIIDNKTYLIEGNYVLNNDTVTYNIQEYNKNYTLYIDPIFNLN